MLGNGLACDFRRQIQGEHRHLRSYGGNDVGDGDRVKALVFIAYTCDVVHGRGCAHDCPSVEKPLVGWRGGPGGNHSKCGRTLGGDSLGGGLAGNHRSLTTLHGDDDVLRLHLDARAGADHVGARLYNEGKRTCDCGGNHSRNGARAVNW